jgi:hypothetical protein
MIDGLSALAYLEYRQIVNRIRYTARQPARVLVYLIALVYIVAVAVMRHNSRHTMPVAAIPEPYASALFFAYITLLGIMMYGAASGIVGAFSSPADARFLSGSLISQRIVIIWLQLRRSGASIGRMIFTLLLYTLIFSTSGTSAGIGLATIGGTLVATLSAIPVLKLRRITGTATAQSLAGAIAAIGILPMAILLATLPPNGMRHEQAAAVERLGAGLAFNALFDGNAAALAGLYGFGVLLIAVSYVLGTGLYPDLYATSMRVLAFRDRQRRGTTAFSLEHQYEHRGAHGSHRVFGVLRGPWTIVWKEWIAFMRSPSMQRMFVFGVLVCAAVGALFGYITIGSKDALEQSILLASTAGNMIVIFVAMGSAIGLSSDISKPLWWMGRDALWLRLLAWTIGASWRLAICLAVGIAAWAIALHIPAIALAGIPIAIAVVLYLRAIGLAIYSLFPSTFDQRGPLAMVRALLTYLMAAPPAFLAAVVLLVSRSLSAGIIAGILCSLIETLLLVAFASARMAGQGVTFARAETM